MTDEITPHAAESIQPLVLEQTERPSESVVQQKVQYQSQMAQQVQCPSCGAANDVDSLYCSTCGALLRNIPCPNCGSEMDADADFCEVCHHYVRHDVCSFCGAPLLDQDTFCHECGSPRGGIVCPVCHSLSEFAFCKQCGNPLTENAKQMVAELRKQPDYQELVQAALEYNELQMELPYRSERDIQRDKACDDLRERVLRLLAQDAGIAHVEIPPSKSHRISKEALDARKEKVGARIMALFEKMATPHQPSPAKARNYAMAQKPAGVRMAWLCNYKHAMHSSPCGCAKPQLGGKWVILGHGSSQEIKDDN